jgi:hypothetical protein
MKFLFWLISFGVCIAWWVHDSNWHWFYALEYDVESTQVMIERKPHDCEWSAAPIGEKHCHYERVISTVLTRPAGGGQMVSNDNWKTWHFVESWLGPISPSVTVSWRRIDE